MAATRIDRGLHHFDVVSGSFNCHIGTLMCLIGTLKKFSWTWKKEAKELV